MEATEEKEPRKKQVKIKTIEDIPMCNCARCGIELLGESVDAQMARKIRVRFYRRMWIQVYGRYFGRPFCRECFKVVAPHEMEREYAS